MQAMPVAEVTEAQALCRLPDYRPKLHPRVIDAWRAVTPMRLRELENHCTDGFGSALERRMDLTSAPAVFHINLAWRQAAGSAAPVATSDFYLDFANGTVRDGNIFVPPAMRGHNIGPRFMMMRVGLGRALGFARMDFTVAGDLGAHVWSRAAIMPTPETHAMLRSSLEDRMTGLETLIHPRRHDELAQACLLERPDDLQRISQMREVMGNEGVGLFLHKMEPTDIYFRLDSTELVRPDLSLAKFMLARQAFIASLPIGDDLFAARMGKMLMRGPA